MFDTEEGLTRNAFLRKTNDELQAKVERYKEAFEGLLEDKSSREASERIRQLDLSPRINGQRESTGEQSHAGHPGHPASVGHHSLSGDDPHTEWLRGGYDPNDGRIAGRQDGWHPILQIRRSQEIQSPTSSGETRDVVGSRHPSDGVTVICGSPSCLLLLSGTMLRQTA